MGFALVDIDKIVKQDVHLKNINLVFENGSRNVILGRTLAGKTSLLRIMAGLDRPSKGRIIDDGNDLTGVSVRKRSVAMVYQQFINYPSLTIYKNIASPLKISGMDKKKIEKKVMEAAEMLRIDHLLDRLPAELSGGQQQRTAIARALVKDASLLLLDEPLVNLDYKLREELRSELRAIFDQREAIVIYTTTEPSEALMLGGNIVVMDEGRVIQTGTTPDVYRSPATTKVAEVFSDPPINYINAETDGQNAVIGAGIKLPLTGHLSGLVNGAYKFGVRSNHLSLNRQSPEDVEISAKVALAEINGSETFIHADHNNTLLVVQEEGINKFKIGSDISVYVHPNRFYVYDKSGQLVAVPENL